MNDQVITTKEAPAMKVEQTIVGNDVSFTMTFGNGEKRTLEINPEHPLYQDMAIFGASVKLRNATALAKGATVAEKLASVDALLEAFSNGEWSTRSAGGEAQPTGGLLAKALANLSGKALPEIQAFLAGFDKAAQAQMRLDPAVAAEITRIKPVVKPKAPAAAVTSALSGLFGNQ